MIVPAFLTDGNEMSRRIAEFDWAATTLGPIEKWPQSLITATAVVVRSPVPMALLWGSDGVMIYNDSYARFAGSRHPDLLGRKLFEAWPEIADFNDNVMKKVLDGKSLSYKGQRFNISRPGQDDTAWLDLDYSPVLGEGSQPAGVLAIVRETTDRVRAEARQRFLDELGVETALSNDAEQILATTTRRVGEYLDIAICAYADMDEDEDGFTIRGDWAAPGSQSIVGHYRLADFGRLAVINLGAGKPLIINDNFKEIAPEEAATFQSLGIASTVCMPLVKSGKLTALMAIHDRVPRVWAEHELEIIRDVTQQAWAHVERSGVEAELRASEDNFRTLASAMPNHVWTSPPDGQLDWFNEQVYAYSGAREGSLDGSGWTEIVHPDDLAGAAEGWARALLNGETYETEFRLRNATGEWRWHIARALPIKGAFGEVIRWIGTNTDIQDQKEVAEALADGNAELEKRVSERTAQLMETEEALRQSHKMEAVGQLTGGIAHDFNNLLGGIGGALELIGRHVAEGRLNQVTHFVEGGLDSVRRAASLTQRLLAFSRQQMLDPTPTDVNRLVAGLEELIRRTVGPGIDLEVVGAGGLWLTRVDAPQLESALLNLAINARDAMPDGGRMTIETANVWLDQRAGAERDLSPGHYISICLTDTGTGMTPDIILRAFDPFFTTKPIGKGTGLGLSMVHGFVRQSGGQVRIDSEVGDGSTICLYLPRFIGEAISADGGVEDEPSEPGHGETVLVIDDEAIIRMLSVETLTEAGYQVHEAADGPAGLRILGSEARIDLLVTDVGLPGGMNGRQVADAARIMRPELKVLFVTGYAENAAIGNGFLGSGMEVLTKPFALSALTSRVRDILDRRG